LRHNTGVPNDIEHLRLLAIFHYIVGGLAALVSLFPLFHLAMGIAMVTGRFGDGSKDETALFGWFFVAISAALITLGLAFSVALIAAGRCLARQTNYLFCLVMAALSCAFMPFGTVLGVFTIIVLQRPSVKLLFAPAPQS
jgi:hypothetical protein